MRAEQYVLVASVAAVTAAVAAPTPAVPFRYHSMLYRKLAWVPAAGSYFRHTRTKLTTSPASVSSSLFSIYRRRVTTASLKATALSDQSMGESWCGHELFNTVTTDWVQDHLDDPEVVIIDIRGRVNKEREEGSDYFFTTYEGLKDDYLDGHIPGAAFVDWTKDIAGEDANGVPAQLADREGFIVAMQERGVGGSKRVVAYDNGEMLFATRFWWAMRRFGYDRVSVMDGGWAKWVAEGRQITPDCPCPLKVFSEWEIGPEKERPELWASMGDVRAAMEDGKTQVLDARAKSQYKGEVRRALLGGHIPGAVNTPYRDFLEKRAGQDGEYPVLKNLEGIRQVFDSAKVDTSPSASPIIAYCNGGVASTLALFGLYQLDQHRRASGAPAGDGKERGGGGSGNKPAVPKRFSPVWSNYDGSWNEWGNIETAPVER